MQDGRRREDVEHKYTYHPTPMPFPTSKFKYPAQANCNNHEQGESANLPSDSSNCRGKSLFCSTSKYILFDLRRLNDMIIVLLRLSAPYLSDTPAAWAMFLQTIRTYFRLGSLSSFEFFSGLSITLDTPLPAQKALAIVSKVVYSHH